MLANSAITKPFASYKPSWETHWRPPGYIRALPSLYVRRGELITGKLRAQAFPRAAGAIFFAVCCLSSSWHHRCGAFLWSFPSAAATSVPCYTSAPTLLTLGCSARINSRGQRRPGGTCGRLYCRGAAVFCALPGCCATLTPTARANIEQREEELCLSGRWAVGESDTWALLYPPGQGRCSRPFPPQPNLQ